MLEVKKKSVMTYQITETSWPTPFSNYGDAENRAKELGHSLEKRGFSKCFVCNHRFERDEDVFLAMVKGHKNMFLCGGCAQKVNAG